ncbi:MAG: anhydro-N-acetylmuramic acid kinase [Bacteroidota bacterium]|nr:anhydro-N-acetylmuramic acid kinase [Bacteroidota bacterium]
MPEVIIGIMSGSSLDGLDMAACQFEDSGGVTYWKLLDSITVPYTDHWHQKLQQAPELSGFELMQLDAEFGAFIGREVSGWIQGKNWKPTLIASHGHTVFHEPALGFTTQIGSGAHIMAGSGIQTITNVRTADVAHGGQGAPFAPVADRALYPGYNAYLNLGGIVNVFLETNEGTWKSWDIGPCNQALNFLAKRAGHAYDAGGVLATQGAVLDSIRHDLVAMFPYQGGEPNGMSNSKVTGSWIEYLLARQEDPIDLLSTTTLAIADMITMHLSPSLVRPARILVTGGGAHNHHLIELLRRFATDFGFNYEIPEQVTIDHKESSMMAYLGYLSSQDRPFGVHSLTGARHDAIGGALHKSFS